MCMCRGIGRGSALAVTIILDVLEGRERSIERTVSRRGGVWRVWDSARRRRRRRRGRHCGGGCWWECGKGMVVIVFVFDRSFGWKTGER